MTRYNKFNKKKYNENLVDVGTYPNSVINGPASDDDSIYNNESSVLQLNDVNSPSNEVKSFLEVPLKFENDLDDLPIDSTDIINNISDKVMDLPGISAITPIIDEVSNTPIDLSISNQVNYSDMKTIIMNIVFLLLVVAFIVYLRNKH